LSFLGEEPRDRLIGAAAQLCPDHGYEEIDEEAITANAGLPASALREHFPEGKEECFAAAENALLRELVSAVGRGYSADRSEWENVLTGVHAILEVMAANPGFAYLGYIFSRQMAPGKVRDINAAGHRMIEAMLDRGRVYSSQAAQPTITALGILGGAQAIVRRELALGRADRLSQLAPDCVYIATVPFLGQREALRLAELSRVG
jgi:AcrR family transcriptional regulator